jgi:Zinc-binding dehydrogenase
VIGADRRARAHNAPIREIAETLIVGAEDPPAEVRAATGGKGADAVFDLVGGVMFRSALKCLAWRGRLVEIAATGQREVSFDLADFYHNESRLFGVDTLKRDLTESAQVLPAAFTQNRHREPERSRGRGDPGVAGRSTFPGLLRLTLAMTIPFTRHARQRFTKRWPALPVLALCRGFRPTPDRSRQPC